MKKIRQFHTYLGTFFAPAIFFFAFTGALQTAGLHESERGSADQPPSWIVTLAELHKDQRLAKPNRKHALALSSSDKTASPAVMIVAQANDNEQEEHAHDVTHEHEDHEHADEHSSWPLKCFVLFLAAGLMSTVLLGVYMAFQNRHNRRTTVLVLVSGIILPLLLLYL